MRARNWTTGLVRRRTSAAREPPPTRRMLRGGLVRFGTATLVVVAAMIVLAGVGMPAAAVAVMLLAAVPAGLWASWRLPGLRFPAVLLLPALVGACVWLLEDPPFGAVASGRPQPLLQAPFVGGYRDHGLRVAREFAVERPIAERRGRVIGTMTVAPLVATDWDAARPVAGWVVAYAFRSGRIGPRHPDHWAAPGELVRSIGRDAAEVDSAIAQALERSGLRAAGDAAAFTWRASAAAAMADQAAALLAAIGIVAGLWGLCVGLLAWSALRRSGRAGA